jgi:hypothetical protein
VPAAHAAAWLQGLFVKPVERRLRERCDAHTPAPRDVLGSAGRHTHRGRAAGGESGGAAAAGRRLCDDVQAALRARL